MFFFIGLYVIKGVVINFIVFMIVIGIIGNFVFYRNILDVLLDILDVFGRYIMFIKYEGYLIERAFVKIFYLFVLLNRFLVIYNINFVYWKIKIVLLYFRISLFSGMCCLFLILYLFCLVVM